MDPEVLGNLRQRHAPSRERATRTTSSRNSLGYGLGITTSFQPTLPGKPTQMSPIRAAVPSLLHIDAGSAPTGLIFDEVTRRIPHEETKDERARRERGYDSWAPRYDYVGTGKLRLHLTNNDRKGQSFEDAVVVHIEDKLAAIMDAIGEATQRAIHWEEVRRCRADEEEQRRKEAERIRALREEYETWEAALHDGADGWERHQAMSAFLAAIGQHPDVSPEFVQWAHGHLDATDPRCHLPSGEQPTWSHAERAENGRWERPKNPWGR